MDIMEKQVNLLGEHCVLLQDMVVRDYPHRKLIEAPDHGNQQKVFDETFINAVSNFTSKKKDF